MKAYAVRTRNEINLGGGSEYEPDEYGWIYEVVVAKSPGHARSIVVWEYDIEFTVPLEIRLLSRDIDLPCGTAWDRDNEDVLGLMVHAAVVWRDMSDAEEFYQWQGWHEALT